MCPVQGYVGTNVSAHAESKWTLRQNAYSGQSEQRFQGIVNTGWESAAEAADFLAVITMEREPERRERLPEC